MGMKMEQNNKKRTRSHVSIVLSFMAIAVSCMLLYKSANPFLFLSNPTDDVVSLSPVANGEMLSLLDEVLGRAAMKDKTVILTSLNDAWAEPDSIFDVFLESFRIGNQTQRLLNHLVVITFDQKAYDRCVKTRPHCFAIDPRGVDYATEAYYNTPDYLEMVWRKIDLLASVLRLGYNFVFTDADIMWLQDPFPRFIPNAEFQIACDFFFNDSFDLNNLPNTGFHYVKSNKRTIQFYEFWYKARSSFPGIMHDQDVFNKMKFDPFVNKNINMQIRFLETNYFGGFCEPSKDFNLVCTMHANCCLGLENKVNDLKLVLQDWKRFTNHSQSSWSIPNKCRKRSFHPPDQTKKKDVKDQESQSNK